MIKQARLFATAAHWAINQRRKYTDEPYIGHPSRVANLVSGVPHSREMMATAWLHDVVEDTLVPIELIRREFGEIVGDMVASLTNVPLSAGNRATRLELNLEKLAQAPDGAKTVKCADLIDNTSSIKLYDPKFAIVYLAEKRRTLEVIKDGADPTLWRLAYAQSQPSAVDS